MGSSYFNFNPQTNSPYVQQPSLGDLRRFYQYMQAGYYRNSQGGWSPPGTPDPGLDPEGFDRYLNSFDAQGNSNWDASSYQPPGSQPQAPPPGGAPGGGGGGGAAPNGSMTPGGYAGGFVPRGTFQQPNAGYLQGPGQTGGNNPYQNFRYGFTGQPVSDPSIYGYNVTPFLDPSGNRIDEKIANDRIMAYAGGGMLQQNLQNWTNYNQGELGNWQDMMASAYDPSNPANMGYTDEEMSSIMNDPYLRSLQLSPEEQQANFLTEGEQQGWMGNPREALSQLAQDESGMDVAQQDRTRFVNQALNSQDQNVRYGLDQANTGLGNALNSYGGNTRAVMGGWAGNVRPYVDPTALNISNEYSRNYNVTPLDMQRIREQAGRTVATREQADEDALMRAANAQGNTTPMALATMRDRMRQTGEINAANAMSDAEIKAKELQLNTTQNRENTRLGAAQNYANLGVGAENTLGSSALSNEQGLGQAQIGAEQYLGNLRQQAEQYLGNSRIANQQQLGAANVANAQFGAATNLGAFQTADQQGAARAAGMAQNRQATNQANQAQTFGRGQYIYGNENQNNTNFANNRLSGLQNYRTYLGGQANQANQNVTIGNQQQAGVFGTMTGAANKASENAVVNYGKPGAAISWLAEGGVTKGPHMALVGEAGPELIIDLARLPKYGLGFDGSGETEEEGYGLPTDNSPGTPETPTGENPIYSNIRKGLYAAQKADIGGNKGDGNWHGALLNKLIGAAASLIPHATGGVADPSTHHPYGDRGKPKGMELITKPEVRMLGSKVPQAVLPLTPRKNNKVTPEMIPGLMAKYGSYGREHAHR